VTVREATYCRVFGADAVLRDIIQPGMTVLDVGSSTGTGSTVLDRVVANSVDIHAPSLQAGMVAGRRQRAVVGDIRHLPFRTGCFDVVVALDVIEHLERSDGERLLLELERVSRRFVVVLTPNGFFPQAALPDQPWFEHKSGWRPRDFARRGYVVEGAGGTRLARRMVDRAPFRGGVAGRALGALSVPFARRVPSYAFEILAVHDADAALAIDRR
jgi:hypothetical protein